VKADENLKDVNLLNNTTKIVLMLLLVSFLSCSHNMNQDTGLSTLSLSHTEIKLNKGYKIAVLPFTYKYIAKQSRVGDIETPINAGEIASKYIETELLQTNKFQIIDRQYLSTILQEHKLNLSGMTQDMSMVGKLLNADGLIVGEVIELNTLKEVVNLKGTCIFTLKLIDVKSGGVIFIFKTDETVTFGDYLDALKKSADIFGKEITTKIQDI